MWAHYSMNNLSMSKVVSFASNNGPYSDYDRNHDAPPSCFLAFHNHGYLNLSHIQERSS